VTKLLRPRVIIPVVVSVALIAGLLSFANAPRVVGLIVRLDPLYLGIFFGLMVAYQAVRCLQWLYLLHHLKVRVPLRSQIFSYLGGALAKYLPVGSYFQNYLLYETREVDPAVTSAATTLIVLTEPAASMVMVFVIGIDGWGWLRWLIGIGLPLGVAFGVGLYKWLDRHGVPRWIKRRPRLKRVADGLERFLEGVGRVAHGRLLLVQGLVAGCYVAIGGIGLYVVELMLRQHGVSVFSAMAAYGFSLTAALVVPVFTDIGTLEVSGVAALISEGASRHAAVAMMVFDRVLIIATSFIFFAAASIAWRDLLSRALGSRGRAEQGKDKGRSKPVSAR
jgi:hypothetical protein